jgi:sulfite reductase (ferredoxin)
MGYYRLPEGYHKTVDEFIRAYEEFAAGSLSPEDFKKLCPALGIYEQKQANTYMQRVRLAGGIVTAELLGALLKLSEQYAGGFLHITTRQNVQFHGVAIEDLPTLQRELADMNLLTKTAGGNCVRNVLIDPLSGVSQDDVFDVAPWGLELSNRLPENSMFATLPRKFKIAVSSSEKDRALAKIADMGLIAKIENGQQGFAVYTGGGLGVSSRIGHEIFSFIPADSILAAATAFNEVFDEYGRDVPRNQSRLRFLIERLGADVFRTLAAERFEKLRNDRSLVIVPAEIAQADDADDTDYEKNGFFRSFATQQRQKNRFTVKIPLFFGHISTETGELIAGFAHKYPETEVRFTQTQNILIRNVPAAGLKEAESIAAGISPLAAANGFISDVKTCAGADFCRLSITSSATLHKKIIEAVAAEPELKSVENVSVGISGCPNGCGHTVISDIGFGGRLRNGKEAYKVYIGGSVSQLGREAGELGTEKIPVFFVSVLKAFRDSEFSDFSLFLQTDGYEKVETLIKDIA